MHDDKDKAKLNNPTKNPIAIRKQSFKRRRSYDASRRFKSVVAPPVELTPFSFIIYENSETVKDETSFCAVFEVHDNDSTFFSVDWHKVYRRVPFSYFRICSI